MIDPSLVTALLKYIHNHPELNEEDIDSLWRCAGETDKWLKESDDRLLKNLKKLETNPV